MNVTEIIGRLALMLEHGDYKTAWSASGELVNDSEQTVLLQAVFQETGAYTVQFAINGKDLTNSFSSRKTRATVTWKVEGNTVQRVIDVVNGTSISGTAQGVTVEVEDLSTGSDKTPYVVSVQVTKGTRPNVQQPPYQTVPRFTIEDGDTTPVDITIPQNDGVISVKILMFPIFIGSEFPDDQPQFDYETIFFRGFSSAAANFSTYLLQNTWIPVPSGTTKLTILQGADGIGMAYTIFFGIDG